MIKIFAKIQEKGSKPHVEDFRVDSLETAEEEIKMVLSGFNNSLRPYEKQRKFICLTEDPSENEKENFDIDNLVLSKREINGYRAIKDKEGSAIYWVKADKLANKKQLKNITKGEFKNIEFVCPFSSHNPMLLNTEYAYINTKCQKCPMLFRYANGDEHDCRKLKRSDKQRIYKR